MAALLSTSAASLDSSRDTTTSLIPAVPYPPGVVSANCPPTAAPTYELIPHRVFVGGFSSTVSDFGIVLFEVFTVDDFLLIF